MAINRERSPTWSVMPEKTHFLRYLCNHLSAIGPMYTILVTSWPNKTLWKPSKPKNPMPREKKKLSRPTAQQQVIFHAGQSDS
jgi:hypothetical protein